MTGTCCPSTVTIVKPYVGQLIKGVTRVRRADGTRKPFPTMDQHGAALFAMCKDGGLPTIRHDTVKWTIERRSSQRC